jgi:hypothetical protein
MIRFKLGVAALGGMVAYWGVQEWRVSSNATDEPVAVQLADVEAGARPENNHWNLGEHLALLDSGVYWYSRSRHDRSPIGPGTRIDYYYYPVLSQQHPYLVQLRALSEKYGSTDAIPEDELPTLENFAVLIKSDQFATIGSIPDTWEMTPQVRGLAVNQIASLNNDEAQLLRDSFPALDVHRVVILEAGRRPSSVATSVGMISGGSIIALLGTAWVFAGSKSA